MFDYFRFRYRRWVRRTRRATRIIHRWVVNYVDRHIWGKWHQVRVVRRFLLLWWAILAVGLVGMLQQMGVLQLAASKLTALPGGTYTEAAVGTVHTLNPVLPESATTADINRLIFSGLTQHNAQRQIVPDLATSWDVSADGRTYTFHLRHGVKWHDGVPFTSADVAFTMTAIQNPDSRSPLASSWQGVKVEVKDDTTVAFSLPQPLDSFLESTTVGIVPRHLLESVEPSQLRTADFNQHPVGTGPFRVQTFAPSAREVDLAANPAYYLGRPKLDGFVFKFYATSNDAVLAFAQHQVTSPGRLLPESADAVRRAQPMTNYEFTLPQEQTLFFATGDKLLSDQKLRQILSRSLDRHAILQAASAGQGVVINQPLLPGQVGYTTKYAQSSLDAKAAASALDAAGWTRPKPNAVRTKDGQSLQLRLVTLAGGELEQAAREIKRQYAALGIEVTLTTTREDDLQQTYMRPRNFQMILYGVNLGADPDVYSFWHSSQVKDPGVNLSGYSSPDADKALEAGRIKSDALIRLGKYDAFLRAWNSDAPAAVLYQTEYVYGTRGDVAGIAAHRLVEPSDRYFGVEHWTVLQRRVNIR